jgi:predicted phosphodiesterase
LPETAVVQAGPVNLYVLHNLRELDLDPKAAGFAAVISGHTHKAENREEKGVLYLNPGSAGPRRFDLPVTVALLNLEVQPWKVEMVRLDGVVLP